MGRRRTLPIRWGALARPAKADGARAERLNLGAASAHDEEARQRGLLSTGAALA
jgi:hypothetical protein